MVLQALSVALLAGILAVWVRRLLALYSARERGPVLEPGEAPEAGAWGRVSIVVPAKDEEANIRGAVETLVAQDYPEIEIIVVDDRSGDRTAAIVREMAAADGRVRLVQVEALPEGWFGKPHAMHVGAGAAEGEWLLFVDADCRQAPESVRTGLGFLVEQGGDMLSLWPVLEMHGFWEHAIQPVAGAVLVAWFRPSWVNDPKHRAAFANGQYILIRRSTYEAVGGHESVRREIVEDIALARVVKGRGHRLLNAVGSGLFTTRMYDSVGAMWRGWTRIYCGGFGSAGWLAGAAALTTLFCLVPFATAAWGAAAVAAGASGWWPWAVVGLSGATCGVLLAAMRRYFIVGRAKAWYVVFYPGAAAVVVGFLVGALARALGFGAVTWRGTTYKGGRVVGGGGVGSASG